VKKNDFHAKVSGKASRARADRAPHFRRGGFVQGHKRGATEDEEPFKKTGKAFEQDEDFRRGGRVRKRQDGGSTDDSGPSFGDVAKAAGKAIGSYKPPTPKNVQAPPLPPPGPGGYQRGGVAEAGRKPSSYDTLKAAGGLKSGGHITTAQRKALPSGEFALPGKGTGAGGKGPGSYPIDTPARARNALARGAQHASPGELATIKRKVHAKYPGIDQGGDND
jgi:hypothetical protein